MDHPQAGKLANKTNTLAGQSIETTPEGFLKSSIILIASMLPHPVNLGNRSTSRGSSVPSSPTPKSGSTPNLYHAAMTQQRLWHSSLHSASFVCTTQTDVGYSCFRRHAGQVRRHLSGCLQCGQHSSAKSSGRMLPPSLPASGITTTTTPCVGQVSVANAPPGSAFTSDHPHHGHSATGGPPGVATSCSQLHSGHRSRVTEWAVTA